VLDKPQQWIGDLVVRAIKVGRVGFGKMEEEGVASVILLWNRFPMLLACHDAILVGHGTGNPGDDMGANQAA
jgi:hypothetical protein